MCEHRWTRLFLFAGFLFLWPVEGIAQQEAAIDPWQFLTLTQSQDFQRWWWAFQQRAYPMGEIPEDAKQRALQQIEQSNPDLSATPQAVAGNRS